MPAHTMIDFISAHDLPLTTPYPLRGDHRRQFTEDGEIVRDSDLYLSIEGAYGATIHLRSDGERASLWGNPQKFLTGQNAFGTADLPALMGATLTALAQRLDLTVSPEDRAGWLQGDYRITRLDLTTMYDLGTPANVAAFLNVASQVAYDAADPHRPINRHGPSGQIETLHIGPGSPRVQFVLYDKYKEMIANPPHADLPHRDRVFDWVAGSLRTELRLGRAWLADQGCNTGRVWATVDRITETYATLMKRLIMPSILELSDHDLDDLPPRLLGAYDSFRAGRDLSRLYSPAQFRRLKKELQEQTGIDISRPRPRLLRPETVHAGGINLRNLIAGPGVPVPDFALGTPLMVA